MILFNDVQEELILIRDLLWKYRWVAWLLPALFSSSFTFLYIHNTIPTQGTVTAILRQQNNRNKITYYPEVTFTDPVNKNVSYHITPNVIGFSKTPEIGDKVDVYFDSQNPSLSKIKSFEEIWSLTLLLTFICVFLLLTGWRPYLLGKTKNIHPDYSWDKATWNGAEPKITYRTQTAIKIIFIILIGTISIGILIQAYTTLSHLEILERAILICISAPLIFLFFFGYLEIFEHGFIYCRHPLFPIFQTNWKDIKKVELKRPMRGSNYFRIHEGPGTTPIDISFSFPKNFSQRNFIELIKQKNNDAALDESVKDWLADK